MASSRGASTHRTDLNVRLTTTQQRRASAIPPPPPLSHYVSSRQAANRSLSGLVGARAVRLNRESIEVITSQLSSSPQSPNLITTAAPGNPNTLVGLNVSPPWRIAAKPTLTRTSLGGDRLLECPVCFTDATAPFLQCVNGHLVCNSCLQNLTSCPTCRAPKPSIRNLLLEKVAQKIRHTCAYANNGCTERIANEDKADHENYCDYRTATVDCLLQCGWKGNRNEVAAHISTHIAVLEDSSTIVKLSKVVMSADCKKPYASQLCLMSAYGCLFLVEIEQFQLFATQCRIAVGCGNLTSLKPHNKLEELPPLHKVKFELSTAGGFQMTWEQPIYPNTSEFGQQTFQMDIDGWGKRRAEANAKDPVLKVTILPV